MYNIKTLYITSLCIFHRVSNLYWWYRLHILYFSVNVFTIVRYVFLYHFVFKDDKPRKNYSFWQWFSNCYELLSGSQMILARALLIETVLAILKVNVLIKVEQMPEVVPRFVNFLFNTITCQSFTNFTFLSFRDSVFVAYVSILKLMKYPLYYSFNQLNW